VAHRRHGIVHGAERWLAWRGDEDTAGGHGVYGLGGVDAIGTAVLGMVLFHEPATMARLVSLALILAGIAGLKLSMP